jgi:hypothetical protein
MCHGSGIFVTTFFQTQSQLSLQAVFQIVLAISAGKSFELFDLIKP